MEQAYIKFLQMIKMLEIKNEKEYSKLLKYFSILSADSLKYISRTRRFKRIIKLAEEVWKGFFCAIICEKMFWKIDVILT